MGSSKLPTAEGQAKDQGERSERQKCPEGVHRGLNRPAAADGLRVAEVDPGSAQRSALGVYAGPSCNLSRHPRGADRRMTEAR
jgi:hypothetical protein